MLQVRNSAKFENLLPDGNHTFLLITTRRSRRVKILPNSAKIIINKLGNMGGHGQH